jgi:hypothetical protein
MKKDEVIEKYMHEIQKKKDYISTAYVIKNSSDRKIIENGFNYAVTSTVEILNELLKEKPNSFREFINDKLGLKPLTQADIDKEKINIEYQKQKLELARIKAEINEQASKGPRSPFEDFVGRGINQNEKTIGENPFNKKKKQEEK